MLWQSKQECHFVAMTVPRCSKGVVPATSTMCVSKFPPPSYQHCSRLAVQSTGINNHNNGNDYL